MLLDLKELIEEFNLEIEGILHIGAHIGEEGPLYQSLNIQTCYMVRANFRVIQQIAESNSALLWPCGNSGGCIS